MLFCRIILKADHAKEVDLSFGPFHAKEADDYEGASMHRELLLEIARDLDSQEVEKLKFLCRNLVPQKELETVKSALDLFQLLLQQLELLGKDRPFLSELLRTICRLDLLRVLETSEEEVKKSLCRQTSYYCRVSPYRKMLYELSENITEDTLKSMKFLLEMPRKFESASFFKVVELMEKLDRLSEDNTEDLYRVLLDCKENRLAAKVKEYAEYIKGTFAETSKDPAMSFGPPADNILTADLLQASDVLRPADFLGSAYIVRPCNVLQPIDILQPIDNVWTVDMEQTCDNLSYGVEKSGGPGTSDRLAMS
ncbi:hypothetical protein GJAV_G00207890 [Gymnothorax javanicus]|nr:hypothetical protein GJAV_G00207890 [Gymnothorax javanicus]